MITRKISGKAKQITIARLQLWLNPKKFTRYHAQVIQTRPCAIRYPPLAKMRSPSTYLDGFEFISPLIAENTVENVSDNRIVKKSLVILRRMSFLVKSIPYERNIMTRAQRQYDTLYFTKQPSRTDFLTL
jgi:hypothetical protein